MARRAAPPRPHSFDPALIKELAGCYARAAVNQLLKEQDETAKKKSTKQSKKELKS
jgi:hypothetical protein